MTGSLRHRGPDDSGFLFLNSRTGERAADPSQEPAADVCLGHRRLSILDLSERGRQPMPGESNQTFIVYNGEIFNYLELRAELAARGRRFRSGTDTEVILHAYEEWGEDCVQRFNGMWAFAIWDQRRRHMFCCRDRFGIKPFYYFLDQEVFVFASEIKGVLPGLAARPRANYGVLRDYLIDGSLCRTSETFFEGIERLAPAHNLVVSAEGVRSTRYWSISGHAEKPSGKPSETFRGLLEDAVKLRLRSDVPVGMALSGGIDSSSILALAGRNAPEPLKCFTAVFPGEPYDEGAHAKIAANACGSEMFCTEYQPDDFLHDLSQVIWAMDYPALEGQVLPRREIMRQASRHVKVILEGQGADEMLAGYISRYFAPLLLDEWSGNHSTHRAGWLGTLRSAQRVLRTYGAPAWISLIRELKPDAISARSLRRVSRANRIYAPEFAKVRASAPPEPGDGPFPDRLSNLLFFDFTRGILPMLLKFGDALSMDCSIESRLPYLDHRLVEFVFGLPAQYKMQGAESKVILREAMRGIVPEEILRRTVKVGFRTPVHRWLAPCMDQVRELLLSKRATGRGIFETSALEKAVARSPGPTAQKTIFRWLSVEIWFGQFIDSEPELEPRSAAQPFEANAR